MSGSNIRHSAKGIRVAAAGTLVSLNLAGCSFGKQDPQVAQLKLDLPPISSTKDVSANDFSLAAADAILRDEKLPDVKSILPDVFSNIDLSQFNHASRTMAIDPNGNTEIFYKLTYTSENPALTYEAKPVIVVLDGQKYSDEDLKAFDAYLSKKGIKTSEAPLKEVFPTIIPTKNAEPTSDSKESVLKLTAMRRYIVPLVVAGVMFSISLYRLGSHVIKGIKRFRSKDKVGFTETPAKNSSPLKYKLRGPQPSIDITLNPGDIVIAESGAMLYRDAAVSMKTVNGQSVGFSPRTRDIASRIMTGESFFFQEYKNESDKVAKLTLAPSKIGQIIQLDLRNYPEGLLANQGAFFASTPGTAMSVVKSGGVKGIFSGYGMFQQKLTGDGEVFLFTAGSLKKLDLKGDEEIIIDSDSVFLREPGVKIDLQRQSITQIATAGEGIYVCKASGKGSLWLSTRGVKDDASKNKNGGFLDFIIRALNPAD